MAKKVTDTQRLIAFAMGADESALTQAIESLTAIKANRYPRDAREPRKHKQSHLNPPSPDTDMKGAADA